MLQIRIPEDLKNRLKTIAKNRGLTLTSLIVIIFEDYLKRSK